MPRKKIVGKKPVVKKKVVIPDIDKIFSFIKEKKDDGMGKISILLELIDGFGFTEDMALDYYNGYLAQEE